MRYMLVYLEMEENSSKPSPIQSSRGHQLAPQECR